MTLVLYKLKSITVITNVFIFAGHWQGAEINQFQDKI